MPEEKTPLIEAVDLKKYYPITTGLLHRQVGNIRAVDGVSLKIMPGETVGLVGESGCGKSTFGRLLLRLERPTTGRVIYRGQDISPLPERQLKWFRREAQMVFQDPQSSLDPRMTVGDSIAEALVIHGMGSDRERMAIVAELLRKVGIEPAHADRYPHQFSGGQKQRIGIARALAVRPRFLVADEPVSALDVSVQAQVLNLLMDLRAEFGLTYLFIAHDLAVVRHMSDRIAVMYLGKIVELGNKEDVITRPLHPYTQALLAAVLVPDPHRRRRARALPGDVPSPASPPPGCRFHPRCARAVAICRHQEPPLLEVLPGRLVSCHRWSD
ncbi:MAG: ATP-binding cassette domain-containing protein [Dehalococcoidia bacterium]|nr:ATP-binding cassette domain-containing protein [Dehalococcoidia bacterium]